MSSQHPIYFQNSLLTPEVARLHAARNHQALRLLAMEAIAEINDSNFETTAPKAHVLIGLWDAIVDGRAVTVVTDTTNC